MVLVPTCGTWLRPDAPLSKAANPECNVDVVIVKEMMLSMRVRKAGGVAERGSG